MYQTLNDHWDGPIDSTVCISLATTPSQGIDLQTVNLDKPIFARCKFTEDNKIWLAPDFIYNMEFSNYNFPNQVYLQGGTGCADNMCSGMYIGIQVPDEAATGTAIRWHQDIPSADSTVIYLTTCVPTEYFNNNYLRELIIKLKPADGTLATDKLALKYAYLSWVGDPNYVSEVIAPPSTYVDTSYQVPI